ncbi:pyrroline-5-carboxylate reductase [Vallitalea okinawensis]|uniref:pyrroline-5-carboxylate reductase n=1 Tax=Vallitalea okinawensis TaxID=2078660 RepID=UPI000CFB444D|nr:pyrroline-5-carboxylate reductase [Vallitalea okinawensis]
MRTIGFIGCGNMAKAMIGGIVKGNIVPANQIIASDLNQESLSDVSHQYGIQTTINNHDVARQSDILVLAVKPHLYAVVINEIKDLVKDNVIVIAIAAGKAIQDMINMFGRELKIVRVMPNTPALVGEGMSAFCKNNLVNDNELQDVVNILEGFGKAEQVDEKLMDVVIATSGSSPAYVYMFIEAMADAAVLDGLPRDKAYKMAAQAVLGAAKMVLETGIHPGQLKDMVCSPGGTTIEAVSVLEEKGLRSAVISAMRTCTNKSKEMSK